jgi:hypothetical protein
VITTGNRLGSKEKTLSTSLSMLLLFVISVGASNSSFPKFEGPPIPSPVKIPAGPPPERDPYGCYWWSRKYNLTIYLKTNQVLEGSSVLCRDEKSKPLRFKLDSTVILPIQTDSVSAEGSLGLPTPDSLGWAFPAISGRISTFTNFPDYYERENILLTKDGGALEPFNRRTLISMTADNPEAISTLRWKRRGAFIGYGMAAAGALIFIPAMFSSQSGGEFHPNAWFAVSIGFLIGSTIPYFGTSDYDIRAIRKYNGQSETNDERP